MKNIIAPSLLSANFGKLQQNIEMLNASEAEWLHIDVMDGRFVPNISFGFPVMKTVQQHSTLKNDVHLMIEEPEKYVEEFGKLGAHCISFHWEACTHVHRLVHQIKDMGIMAGIAINPSTPVSFLEDIVQDLDLILLMSVNPGFGGQKFIPHTFAKIQQTKSLIELSGSNALIEVDGGVSLDNASELFAAGANVLVAGNAVFSSANPSETISQLKK